MSQDVFTDESQVLARSLAAEDLRCGDQVSILYEVCEVPSFLWCVDTQMYPPEEPIRLKWRSHRGGTPLRIKAICLPFVLVTQPAGPPLTIDVARCHLVRLDDAYADQAWERLQRAAFRRGKRRKSSRR